MIFIVIIFVLFLFFHKSIECMNPVELNPPLENLEYLTIANITCPDNKNLTGFSIALDSNNKLVTAETCE